MAALKDYFTIEVPGRLAAMVAAVWPAFDSKAFLADAIDGFDILELMDRGRHVADALRRHLPDDYPEALAILMRSIGPRPGRSDGDGGMSTFFYLPHVLFVARHGLDRFDESMQAQYELTKRFTAEFSIRPFIDRYPDRALRLLRQWAFDRDEHVRRLVSEGTRPRLPWAGRLRRFQEDPSPVLELLELLKDDPAEYVRRSVANNLNDIGRDHPERLVATARRWLSNASADRRALVRHALRSLVKAGHPGALDALGYGTRADVSIEDVTITPRRVAPGGKVAIEFTVRSRAARPQRVLVDVRIHFVRARGTTSSKVFKLKALELEGRTCATCRKSVSLADLTTRRHYPGRHDVDAIVNGRILPIGHFTLTARRTRRTSRTARAY